MPPPAPIRAGLRAYRLSPGRARTGAHRIRNGIPRKANLDRIGQSFVRIIRPRQGQVYYPLWVIRYDYRGRSFQVVIDATLARSYMERRPETCTFAPASWWVGWPWAPLGGGRGLLDRGSSSKDDSAGGALAMFVIGLSVMYMAYRRYRYGEHYEYRRRFAQIGGSTLSAQLPIRCAR